MKKFLAAVVASLLAATVFAANVGGGGVSGLRVHNHSAASLGGSTLSGVTCSGCTLSGSTTLPSNAGAALIHVQTQTATSGTAIDFTLPSGYKKIIYDITRCYTGSAGELMVAQVSTDGTTFIGGANYDYEILGQSSGATVNTSAANTSAVQLQTTNTISNNVAHGGYNGTVELHNYGSTAAWKWFVIRGTYLGGGVPSVQTANGAGVYKSTTAVLAVRFRFASGGTFADCTISEYAVRNT